jgi:hypothetical protein
MQTSHGAAGAEIVFRRSDAAMPLKEGVKRWRQPGGEDGNGHCEMSGLLIQRGLDSACANQATYVPGDMLCTEKRRRVDQYRQDRMTPGQDRRLSDMKPTARVSVIRGQTNAQAPRSPASNCLRRRATWVLRPDIRKIPSSFGAQCSTAEGGRVVESSSPVFADRQNMRTHDSR